MAYRIGRNFIRALQESLGLGDRAVRRIVLDVCIDDAVRVYVEEFVDEDKMSALLSELPHVRPEVLFVDRVGVENGNGSEVVVKQVKRPDGEERQLCRLLLQKYAASSEDERAAIRKALAG